MSECNCSSDSEPGCGWIIAIILFWMFFCGPVMDKLDKLIELMGPGS